MGEKRLINESQLVSDFPFPSTNSVVTNIDKKNLRLLFDLDC